MHGGYPGEEAFEMELFIADVIIPELPEKHGQFSICVCPELQERTTVFTLKDRLLTMISVNTADKP